MEYIKLTKDNLEAEHICCAISNNRDIQVQSKKAWLRERFSEGLVFLKADARGKCFIEYIPAEYAWVPIKAYDYMYINCFWVSGSLKGNGYATELLDRCICDSKEKGKKGLCVLTSAKKRGFLSDPKFLRHKGFCLADATEPYFELMYFPFCESYEKPEFLKRDIDTCENNNGFTIYYSSQCPFTAKYVPLLESLANEKGIPITVVHFTSAEQVRNSPAIFSSFSLFYNGNFITHEILSEKKFLALCDNLKK